jgi:predicted amidophosphoribosyltransferase
MDTRSETRPRCWWCAGPVADGLCPRCDRDLPTGLVSTYDRETATAAGARTPTAA